ncbi:uncharacterized protein LOC116298551 [Actinia tenebrosa]|uniref:Uncharacterized protein LOC116298551 n=1 Tax=Actinia tenebrosa TaxID=6105 RepID=A0A6P8ICT3_ACTTE|nr:uncharacterized protein LOC116298551 [Actinia tenebrosa]
MSKLKPITIGSLIKKDLNDSYFLPAFPSSYSPGYRFNNDKKYRVYDCPPPSKVYSTVIYPSGFLPTVGDEVATLIDYDPPEFLLRHWKTWLPAFPTARLKTVDEGLKDDLLIVTNGPIQSIPVHKHSIDPDVHYQILRKSSLLDIDAPSPKNLTQENLSFPCVVKVDISWCGQGGCVVHNAKDLNDVLKEIRQENGWKDTIIFQEMIQGIKEVPSFQFYLQKSGDVHWIGTSVGGFDGLVWTGSVVDWNKQDYYKNLVYDEFVVPVVKYLHKQGYFGLVTIEILITDHGMYLVDMNPRVGGETSQLLLAPYMAQFNLTVSSFRVMNIASKTSASHVIEKANDINNTHEGKVIVLSAADVDEKGCMFDVCVFAKTLDEVDALCHKVSTF